jgi:hypothetical protein
MNSEHVFEVVDVTVEYKPGLPKGDSSRIGTCIPLGLRILALSEAGNHVFLEIPREASEGMIGEMPRRITIDFAPWLGLERGQWPHHEEKRQPVETGVKSADHITIA